MLRRCLSGSFLQVFQQLDCLNIGLELGLRAAFAQVIVGDTEILGTAAQIGLVFLIRCFLGSFNIGECLPLAIDLDRYRVFVQHFILGLFRLDGRRRLRFVGFLGMRKQSLSSRFGVFQLKAIQLTGIQPAQQRRNLVPAKIAHSQTLFICVQNFQLNTFGRCPVVCGIAGFQLHCFHNVGIGPAQP